MPVPVYEMPEGTPLPEPILEPGMKNRSTGDIVDKIRYKRPGYKVAHPGWRYTLSGVETSLAVADDYIWPEDGQKPEFRRGQVLDLKVLGREELLKVKVMTQSSLNGGAHVDYVPYAAPNRLYSIPKTTFEKMVVKISSEYNGVHSAAGGTALPGARAVRPY